MWIRTQGKSCLIKCNIINVEIGEQSDDYLIRTLLDNGRTFILACYKSEERALEVLDEIQRLIEDLKYMEYAIDNNKFCGYRPNVYRMPEV